MADYLDRIAEIEENARELESQLSDPDVARQAGLYQKLAKSLGKLRPILDVGARYKEIRSGLDEAREHVGHLDPRELAIGGVGIGHVDGEGEGEVRDVGERVTGIDR